MSVGRDGSSLADSLRSDQRQRWLAGERVLVEDYVEKHPELRSDPEALFEIIAGEFRLREELGEFPDVSEYALRFPEVSDRLSRLSSTDRDGSEARNRSTRATGPFAPAGLHCRFCGRISRPKDISEAGDVRCEHCGKVLMVVEETTPYEMTSVAVIGRFELREHLGSGQFGDVWRAYDVDLRREVAVKIPRRMPENRAMHALFQREARAAARLKHPNIVPIHEIGKADERIYIVSDYIKGTTLKKWIEQRKFKPREAAELCVTIARALHHAHQEGIVHRDLKPGNILMDLAGQPHIADFGLAKQSNDDATLTVQGQVLGTPAYMSPEQARGEAHKADRRCDIYSLGVMLYELLTGQRPFQARDEVLIYEILNVEPPPPRKLNRAVPRDLETICLKAMAKDPALRYPSADELADDVGRFLKEEPICARRTPWIVRAAYYARRQPMRTASCVLVSVLVAILCGLTWYNRQLQAAAQPASHPVRIETDPPADTIVFVRLDPITGLPLPESLERRKGGIAELVLETGDYLVVADKAGYGFHEVYRHVPDQEDVTTGMAHQRWEWKEGVAELPRISIPPSFVTQNMALIEGRDKFRVGSSAVDGTPLHHRRIRDYYLDPTEFTVGEYRRITQAPLPLALREDPPADEEPLRYLSFDGATAFAESVGKRLPDEVEYEYAATRQGTAQFPWGDQEDIIQSWPMGPVGNVPHDRLDTKPSIVGLYSNVSEWTASWWAHYPPNAQQFPPFSRDHRIVRGGPCTEGAGQRQWNYGTRYRVGIHRTTARSNIGFRCARSLKPRLTAEDFVTVLPD